MKNISIIGSTGSIGTQTLDVVNYLSGKFKVVGLAAHSNVEKIFQQIKKFKPRSVALYSTKHAKQLRKKILYSSLNLNVEVYSGMDGLEEIASLDECDVVVNSVVGSIGIKPTVKAIESGKDVALANKETLVSAGKIVMEKVKKHGTNMIPIDSEHSAVFQCLRGESSEDVNKIILTASGGPFRNYSRERLERVTINDTLKHPTWKMGKKISVDSATLMNKGFEVIEAHWLFGISYENIEVVIHPQSIVHSMIEFVDGSVIAQLGIHDMRIPIQYALTFPERLCNSLPKLNLNEYKTLTFEKPNTELFPCLKYAYNAGKTGGTMPAVMNAADEIAVHNFLSGNIKFIHIPKIIHKIMEKHKLIKKPTLEQILESDEWARKETWKFIGIADENQN